jgi:putative ABC transport system permease protein
LIQRLFSVLSYVVGKRRREFGVRSAIGASPRQIGRLVLRDGALVSLKGIVIGLIGAAFVARALTSLQYGVTPGDPATWALVLGILVLTTLVASWRPARKAMRVDPVELLKAE